MQRCYLIGMLLIWAMTSSAADIEFEFDGFHVRDFALSASGDELYVTMESLGKDASQIVRLRPIDGGWGAPEVATFSGQFKDLEPFLHPNGKQLFFASNRNPSQTAVTQQFDLWVVERANPQAPWGPARRLGEAINTPDGNEFYPSVASNGNLYFTATKADGAGKEDIYLSRWNGQQYGAAELLPAAINSATYEFNAFISPAEDVLIFSSYGRPDGHGGGDLYVSRRVDGQWQPAANLGPKINTPQLDYCPFYDANKQLLYWTSNASTLGQVPLARRDFKQWQTLYTQGKNGQSKIYRQVWSANKL
ncbi:TolB family protein [Marinicella meishanensis]|uniref:TolB family protein n=1 Tax=Marinicella meishanensis TaxID=2873263 RepID=UPI001CBD4730|nr:hypothetical protein [Marinicella sp. NBU2979]